MEGPVTCDTVIVGGGLTGLWTALYLLEREPGMDVVVIDRTGVGTGASGRNGGWCSTLLPMSLDRMARQHGRAAARRMQVAMHSTLDEIERVVTEHDIDAGFRRGGSITAARSAPQEGRIAHEISRYREFGFDEDDYRLLDADEAADRCAMTRIRGALYTPHCAAAHPARLTHGVARLAVAAGARILSPVRAERIEPCQVTTDRGVISARVVVRATEGYTSDLQGEHRTMIPLYSMMVATEPLDASTWDAIGLRERETFDDGRHMVIYGQRTADDRFAFGGRGAPYHFGSRIEDNYDTDERVRSAITETLIDLFPMLSEVRFTHHWGGPLAAPRDWACSVDFDRRTGLARAGGYVGDGVSTTNLAGRTLATMIAGEARAGDDELLRLPWVGHRSRRWEPEPVRWLGINAGRRAADIADRIEERTGKESQFFGGVLDGLLGR
ncbi:MAG: FAD-dependent oxidoreductase [Actinobacteria bacterium]|nr:FAD-dependent oxidoreductase [Actinomycetota bacterium]